MTLHLQRESRYYDTLRSFNVHPSRRNHFFRPKLLHIRKLHSFPCAAINYAIPFDGTVQIEIASFAVLRARAQRIGTKMQSEADYSPRGIYIHIFFHSPDHIAKNFPKTQNPTDNDTNAKHIQCTLCYSISGNSITE